jgi:hypothetical protein
MAAPKAPEPRAQDTATVERQRGQQVEGEEQKIGPAEPLQDRCHGIRESGNVAGGDEAGAKDSRHRRASQCHTRFGARRVERPGALGDAAEHPQRDPAGGYSLPPCLQRVPELM